MICNMPDFASQAEADAALSAFKASREAMAKAAEHMLAVSKIAARPEQRQRYDHAHKKMRRIMREWNTIEHERERQD